LFFTPDWRQQRETPSVTTIKGRFEVLRREEDLPRLLPGGSRQGRRRVTEAQETQCTVLSEASERLQKQTESGERLEVRSTCCPKETDRPLHLQGLPKQANPKGIVAALDRREYLRYAQQVQSLSR